MMRMLDYLNHRSQKGTAGTLIEIYGERGRDEIRLEGRADEPEGYQVQYVTGFGSKGLEGDIKKDIEFQKYEKGIVPKNTLFHLRLS